MLKRTEYSTLSICRWEEKWNKNSRQDNMFCLFFCVKSQGCLDDEPKIFQVYLSFLANHQMTKPLSDKKHKNVIELRRKTPMLASGMKAAFLFNT